ncbi:LTA synthase family protein [Vibrio breoganii]
MLFWLVIFLHISLKAFLVDQRFYFSDLGYIVDLLISDLMLMSIICILLIISTKSTLIINVICRKISYIILLLFTLDVVLLLFFNTRLYVSDISKFYNQLGVISDDLLYKMLLILFVYALLMAFCFTYRVNLEYRKRHVFIISLIFVSTSLLSSVNNVDNSSFSGSISVRDSYFKNFIYVNVNSTHKKKYTKDFIDGFDYVPVEICEKSEVIKPKNIIIFLVESWSNYHSLEFGDENDWTNGLDELAKQNIKFNNFFANGFTTESGLYSLFTGYPLLPYGKETNLSGGIGLVSMNNEGSLIRDITDMGYNSYFITSGNTDFLNKREWLYQIGFEHIIDNSFFPIENRNYPFSSVPDKELFEKAEEFIRDSRDKFIVVENVTTHAPFLYPGENDEPVMFESGAFEYTDHYLSKLIRFANQDDNLIFVLSDHRAMTEVTMNEINRSELLATSHVPGFAIWNGLSLSIKNKVQHTDILKSVVHGLRGEICYGEYFGALIPFNNQISSKCIIHARGDDRRLVTMKCDDTLSSFNVLLDGDHTRLIDSDYDNKAINIINYLRIKQNE